LKLNFIKITAEDVEGGDPDPSDDDQLAEQKQEICHLVQNKDSKETKKKMFWMKTLKQKIVQNEDSKETKKTCSDWKPLNKKLPWRKTLKKKRKTSNA